MLVSLLDDATDNAFSYFLKTRDQLSSIMIPFVKGLNAHHGLTVRYIHCNNAGENIALERESAKKSASAFSLNTLHRICLNKIVKLSVSLQRYGDAYAP